ITYHASHNIGSMLQTYALQYLVKARYNKDVEIVNFSSEGQRNMYSMFPKPKNHKGLVKLAINLFSYPILKSRFNDFECFINNEFQLSKNSYKAESELAKLHDAYDYIVAGSDQIWNVNCDDFSDAYFVPFKTRAKKIAYAPSLGGRNILNSNVDLKKYKDYIGDFDCLSVRERNGKKWMEELSGQRFEVVADPTILVERDVWETLVPKDEYPEKYIFFYGVPFSSETYDFMSKISKKLDLPVVMLDAKSYIYRGNFIRGFKLWKSSSPVDYLGLIKNASLVITTSFHGSIFSTIFKKNFWAVTFKETNVDDDRIKVLFEQLGLESRLIYIEEYENYDLMRKVDYSSYEKKISEFRAHSFSFLDKAFDKK
ncbi:hypothetical protein BZG72_16005, partial [Salinivibrio sp. PR6]|uniref:polysaccharide pyruvyl transferase family protein n=1 Tax=Salinivibrio sp. PR6 TaxID=1909485 RepID=UPI000988B705